jgi:hypothetical protein
VLPLVLLGIRTASREDLQASVAELMYGEPLRIPGELLTLTAEPVDPAHLITELRQHMARLRPLPAARHTSVYIRAQQSREVHPHLPPPGYNTLSFGTPLQWPLPGPVTESEDSATSHAREACHCVNRQGQAGLHPQRD